MRRLELAGDPVGGQLGVGAGLNLVHYDRNRVARLIGVNPAESPADLARIDRDAAGLDSEVVVVGALNRLELWSPDRWDHYSEQMDQPEALAESLDGLGI